MVRKDQWRKQEAEESGERMDIWTMEDLYAMLLPNLGTKESVLETHILY
jgi:hypothetical protein